MTRRKRDTAAEYAIRNARAREAGFSSYYDMRVRGGAKATRETPKPTGERLREARGHAGPAAFQRLLASGRADLLIQEPGARNAKGQVTEARVTVQLTDGTQRRFRLRGKTIGDPASVERLRTAVRDSGVDLYLTPSQDVIGLGDVALDDEGLAA